MNGKEAQKHGECLNDEVLTDYLEGTLDPVVRTACEAHLIACDPCRENLALFMKVLRDEVNPEEDAAVQELAALWDQRNPRPVPVVRQWSLSKYRRRYIAGAAAAVVLAGVLITWMSLRPEVSRAAQITAAMVKKDRPFEPRIVGQAYLPIREFTRSPDVQVSDVLEQEMTSQTKESYEVGRFFLLSRKYPQAIKYLKLAVADPKGVPADVHNDLGVAYLESKDLKSAEAEFKEALIRNSVHQPALFNLSVLYKRENRIKDAQQWGQRYIAVDPDSEWTKELQSKLSGKESAEQ